MAKLTVTQAWLLGLLETAPRQLTDQRPRRGGGLGLFGRKVASVKTARTGFGERLTNSCY